MEAGRAAPGPAQEHDRERTTHRLLRRLLALGAFVRVPVPLAKPGIVATGILSFIFSCNNFLFSLIIAGFKTLRGLAD